MKRRVRLAVVFAAGAVAGRAQAQSCTAPSFGPTLGHPLGAFPHGLAVGDFNRDGHADLAVGRYWDVALDVLLGDGAGGLTLAHSVSFVGGTTLESVVAADFDRDGKLDLAVAEAAPNQIALLRGTGSGTFSPPSYHLVGLFPRSLAVADFNRDGKPDLVAAAQDGAFLLMGDGAGGFAAPTLYMGAGRYLRHVITADLNRDGSTDVVTVTTRPQIKFPPPSRIFVLMGDGTGQLGTAFPYDTGTDESSVAAADFTGDGILDLAATDEIGLVTFTGRGDGSFAPPTRVFTGPTGRAVLGADIDGSGTADVVVSGHFQTRILLSLGGGAFGPPNSFAMGNFDGFFTLGDLDGDGRPDLVVEGDQNVDVRLNTFGPSCPLAAFGPLPGVAPIGHTPIWLGQGDLNRDGRQDLVATSGQPPQVRILHGDGAGGFVAAATLPGGPYPTGVAVADFNRDGFPDLAVSSEVSNDITLLRGSAGGTYQSSAIDAGGETYGIFAEDLNRDGRLDLVVSDVLSDQVRILIGNGQGGFSAPQVHAVPSPWRAYPGDLNRDGSPDLAVAGDLDAVTLLFGDGAGGFPNRITLSVPGRPRSIALADFDRDGAPDVAVQVTDGPVRVFFGDGAGGFPASVVVPAGTSARAMVALDFNGDGRLDLAVAQGGGAAGVLLMAGTGNRTFGAPELVGAGGNAIRLVAGAFDADGRTDLALLDFNQDAVLTHLNTRCTPRRLALATNVSACNTPGVPLHTQPIVEVQDEGGNRARCAAGVVAASLLGATGATLGGTPSRPVVQGQAAFTDLYVDLPGRGYRLGFELGAFTAQSRTMSQGLTVEIAGPSRVCPGAGATFTSAPGYDSYLWELDGSPISTGETAVVGSLPAGPHSVRLAVWQDTCTAEDLHSVSAGPPPAVVSGDTTMCAVSAAVVRADLEGTPPWSLTWSDGLTQTGVTTTPVLRTVRPAATATYTIVSFADAGCMGAASGSATVTVDPLCTARFHAVKPCRLVDTRDPPGPSGGPALGANSTRDFPVSGLCQVPATAKAVAVNLTAVNPSDMGHLRLFPSGTPLPSTSALNFSGATRANNAVVALGAGGRLSVLCSMTPGALAGTHLALDVFGYFE